MRRFIDQLNFQARVAIVFDGSAAHPKLEHLLSIADVQAEQCVGFVPALDIAASHP